MENLQHRYSIRYLMEYNRSEVETLHVDRVWWKADAHCKTDDFEWPLSEIRGYLTIYRGTKSVSRTCDKWQGHYINTSDFSTGL